MIYTKYIPLDYLINSEDCLHLSCYLSNQFGLHSLKKQINAAVKEFKDSLSGVILPSEIEDLLDPFKNFQKNHSLLSSLRGGVGIFRNRDKFIIVDLPFEVDDLNITASSFHIKPLLSWFQTGSKYLVLGIQETRASLQLVNGGRAQEIGTIEYLDVLQKYHDDFPLGKTKNQLTKQHLNEVMDWINGWILKNSMSKYLNLYVVGSRSLRKRFMWRTTISDAFEIEKFERFSLKIFDSITNWINNQNRREKKSEILNLRYEYEKQKEIGMTSSNIFEIAKAAARGDIKKLILSKSNNIFGTLDNRSGEVKIHYSQLDHEDDCLLDDIAQLVLKRDGEVLILPDEDMPESEPLLAILKNTHESSLQIMETPLVS